MLYLIAAKGSDSTETIFERPNPLSFILYLFSLYSRGSLHPHHLG